MNDRFKFRIFLKAHNHMCNVHTLHIGTNKVIVSSRYGNHSVQINDSNILMQCTGLKDKNGTLIYEGDILKIESGKLKMENIYGCVKWCDTIASFGILNNNSHYDFKTFDLEYIEVIGNIYENKELLEGLNE